MTPPGQWSKFAEIVSAADANTLDEDVLMFFVLGQAMLDASIACWDAKRYYDSVRPVTLIRWAYKGQDITAWGGPGSTRPKKMKGENWLPYQRPTVPSPAFPEFCLRPQHLQRRRRGLHRQPARQRHDHAQLHRFPPTACGSTRRCPPPRSCCSWPSLSAAADAAGMSRRHGGIHFEQGDLKGRALGRQVAQAVLAKYATLRLK